MYVRLLAGRSRLYALSLSRVQYTRVRVDEEGVGRPTTLSCRTRVPNYPKRNVHVLCDVYTAVVCYNDKRVQKTRNKIGSMREQCMPKTEIYRETGHGYR